MPAPPRPPHTLRLRALLLVLFNLGGILLTPVWAQSIRKLERRAINRSHLTFVNGDTVQRFTLTDAQPSPRPGRFYYWKGPGRILRTAGAYDGRLLTDDYRLTNREGHLLVSGRFRKGLKTGLWQSWRYDGTLLSQSHWQGGLLRGRVRQYDEAGRRVQPAKVAAPATPARFWQSRYWKQVWQTRRQRWAARRAAGPAPAPTSPTPTLAGPATTPAGSPLPAPAEVKRKPKKQKVKRPRNQAPVADPILAPTKP